MYSIRVRFVIPLTSTFCENLVPTKANFNPKTAKVLPETTQLRTKFINLTKFQHPHMSRKIEIENLEDYTTKNSCIVGLGWKI